MKHNTLYLIKLIIVFIFFMSCNEDNKENRNSNKKIVSKEIEVHSKPDKDSLGYPSYYTHPEINEIFELNALLNKADKVIAYNFNGNNGNSANVECENLYDSSGICESACNEKILNKYQIQDLINITCDTNSYDGSWSGLAGVCFIPHLGFGFFKKDSLIAQVNICFLCSGIRTKPYYKSDGLSNNGRFKYVELAKKLNLKVVDGSENLSY